MTWLSLGSLALPFHLGNEAARMRADISRLGGELTTGLVHDPSRHLKGATEPLATITTGLARTESYLRNARTAAIRADMAQGALGVVETIRGTVMQDLLLGAEAHSGDTLSRLGNSARTALADSVSALSARGNGVALFSGVASDSVPLVSADEMFSGLSPLFAGITSADVIADTIAAQFLDPGGLFETDFYRGGAPATGTVIGDGETLAPLPTADTRATRMLLAGLATAAVLADPPSGLSDAARRELSQRAAALLMSAAGGLAGLQAETGALQATLESRQTRLLAERDTLTAGKLALISADPFERATRLQDTQARLEALYTVTARTARLSLTGYLR